MKKLIAFLMVAGLMTFGFSNLVVAQEEQAQTEQTEQTVAPEQQPEVAPVETVEEVTPAVDNAAKPATFRESIKKQFIDGGPAFMGIVLIILLIGMAISIERIIYLTLASANSKKLLAGIEAKMKNGDVEGAKQLCKDTRGPVASIFTQGLIRYQDISLAPMFGFMGTVIGMIQAFDDIAAAGDMSPQIVASGMKVALLTTVFGLIAAIILQIFFNFIASKIENIVNDMEDASISFMDILAKYNNK